MLILGLGLKAIFYGLGPVVLALALHVCGLGLGLDTSGLVNIPGLDKRTNVTDGQPENIMSLSP